jgi:hypothetical protein
VLDGEQDTRPWGQGVGQLSVAEVGELLVARRLDDPGSLALGELVGAHLRDRRDVAQVLLGERVRIASCDPSTHPARIDHEDLAGAGDRHPLSFRFGDGHDEPALDLRGETAPADGPVKRRRFSRSRVFSMASSWKDLLTRRSSCSSATTSGSRLGRPGPLLNASKALSRARSRMTHS